MKKKYAPLLFLCLLMPAFITSCGNKKEDPAPATSPPIPTIPNPTVPELKGTLSMHLHNYIDATEVDDYNIVYTNSDGRKISLEIGQFYLSHFELTRTDGTVYTLPDSIVLKLQDQETYEVADIPVGKYKQLSFYIGLDAKKNQTGGQQTKILNKPEMMFADSKTNGYIFFNFQGKIDTTTAATGSASTMQPFKYLIGTQKAYKKITMPEQSMTVVSKQVIFAHIYADYNKIFTGIDLRNKTNLSVVTPEDNATAIAEKVINNIATIFIYE